MNSRRGPTLDELLTYDELEAKQWKKKLFDIPDW